MPGIFSLVRLIAVLALILGSVVANGATASSTEPAPTIASDKADYAPGSTVTLTGVGWAGDTSVHISVNDTLGKSWQRQVDVTVDGDGHISDSFVLPTTFVAEYDVLATGQQTGRTATTTFTDSSADLDQCANGGVGNPPESCNNTFPTNWVNGNLNASKSHFFEGDSIPYRMKLDGLVVNSSNTLIIAWDVTDSSKHAIDYLTSFDRTVTDADPCTGIAGCSLASETTFPITQDPAIPFAQVAGVFSTFGGSITSVSGYGLNPGSNSCPAGTPDYVGSDVRCIVLTFTATQSNPVIAWGGHIATRANWGAGNAAVNIAGSPFHMRLIALNGSGGNQDRSLSNDAVIFPATIRIIKHTEPPSSSSFGFTGSPSPVTNFSLTDNDAGTDPSQSFTMDAPAEFTTYTIAENAASGYLLSSISCIVTDANGGSSTTSIPNRNVIINIKEGETRTCTFTNDLQTGTLTVIKHVVNNDGGGASAGDWSIHVKSGASEVTGSPQNGAEAGTTYTLNAGTYDVSETGGPGGYTFDGFTGDCNLSGSVTVVAGQNRTCTLTNSDDTPQLKLVKDVTNNDGGGATAADFTLSAAAPGNPLSRNFSSQTASPVFHPVAANATYTLSESGPDGYSSDGVWSCTGGTQVGATIQVPLGAQVTCTITNTDDTPQLKLVKEVTNNDGGTATAASFNLSATGSSRSFSSQTASPVFHDVTAGVTYTLSETGPDGYTAGSWSCDGGNQVGDTIQVPLGAQVTCTITNTDDTPQLKLVKEVTNNDGGDATAADFTLSAAAPGNPLSRNFSSQTASPIFHDVAANATYTLSETGPDGYAGGAWVCTGDGNQVGDTISVPLGGSATCTVTNTDNTPRLKLVKVVTNNDGGTATAASFTLAAAAAGNPLSRNFSYAGNTDEFRNVAADAVYTLSESGPGGYTPTAWSCDGGTQSGGTISVPLGLDVTCTITNTDDTPQLKLVKEVTNNDGGTATAASFNLSAAGSSRSFSSQTASPVFHDVTAGVTYTLSETGPDGYTAGSWSCDGGNQVGDTIQVPLGAQVTCTITNTDDTPQLKLVKEVTNNDGGTATAASFNLSAAGSSRSFSSQTASPVFHDVTAGVTYTLSETGPDGYTAGSWSCDGGNQVGASVELALGESVTCTITNTDDTPQLKLVKEVTNNDGGTATAASFNLSATGSSRSFSSQTASPVFHDVTAGVTYTLSETGPDGYSAGSWSCDGGNQVGASVELALGESVTCTITNTDDTPQLKLVKEVTNNDGGTATAASFNLSAAGSSRSFSSQTASPVFHDVTAGVTYTLSETGPDGYTAGSWSCTGGGNQVGASVELALGESVTCTITNTDDTPQLKLVKEVTNNDGGDATAADFTLSAAAAGNPLSRNFSSQTASPIFHPVAANATYTLSETGPDGYTAGSWSCDGGNQVGASVELALGESVTCTITNTDDTPQLKLVKEVTNNDGGTATAASFNLSATGSSRSFSSQTASPVFHDVTAGVTYTLSESGPNGYTAGSWSCDGGDQVGATIVVPLGGSVTCTIANTDNTPRLKLVKLVPNDDGGTATPADFTLAAAAPGNPLARNFSYAGNTNQFRDVAANAVYTLTESGPAGYTASAWTCDGGSQVGNTVQLALGAQVTCTITNNDNTPRLKLVKIVTNNDGGTKVANEWTLSATAAAPNDGRNFSNAGGSGVFQDVFAGTSYTLAESPNPGTGYSSSGQWSCDGGTMSAGDTVVTIPLGAQVTCTITNTDDTPTLKLVKNVSGGSATANSFTLAAAAPAPNNGRNFSNAGGSGVFQNVFANATYTLSETGPAGYTPSAWSCDGGTQVGATIQVPLGAAVTCSITNTRDRGTITAIKYHDLNADGSHTGDPGLGGWTLFVDLDKTGTLTAGDLSGTTDVSGSVSFPGLETTVNGATYWVCEVLQANWVNSDPGAGSVTANGKCKAVTVAKDTTTTVRLGNFQRIKIQVNKTLDQLPVPNGLTFQFSIRKDASTNPAGVNGGLGTVIATGSVTGPDGAITSAEWSAAAGQQYPLNPGTYQLCESIVEGYTPHWTQGAYGVDWFSPGIQAAGGFQETENTLVCINFTVVSGDGGADNTVEFNVDNITRGFSHTIGFWKNWTSCDGTGGQFAMLDLMITGGTRNGITYQGADDSNGNGLRDIRIGNLYIEGPNACKIAVDLLDKRPVGDPAKVGDKAKASSDPVYNSVSQLVAFELNQLLNATGTGSAACQAKATDAARLMQRFLTYINFRMSGSNSTYTMPSNKTQVKQIEANLLYLANVIDDYNNNTIGGCAAALALPYPTVAGTNPLQTWGAFLPAYTDT